MASSSSKTIKDSELKALEDFYFSEVSLGRYPKTADLKNFCVRKKYSRLPSSSDLRGMRSKFKATAMFSRFEDPRPSYMSSQRDSLGNVMVDMAHYKPELSGHNGGMCYFIVGVDCLTGAIACFPYQNKSRESWENAISNIVVGGALRHVKTIITDRDTAIASKKFQEGIYKKYGVRWHHIMNRGKAYKAERMIAFIKNRLSKALEAKKAKGEPPNWVSLIPNIVKEHNDGFIEGTDVVRRKVNKHNYVDALAKIYGDEEAPHFAQSTSLAKSFSKKTAAKLFKFDVGDNVLLSVTADYTKKSSLFSKKTVEGAYGGDRVYRVTDRGLKRSITLGYNVCYQLAGLKGWFYETELIKASFREDSDDEEDEPMAGSYGPSSGGSNGRQRALSSPAKKKDSNNRQRSQRPTKKPARYD